LPVQQYFLDVPRDRRNLIDGIDELMEVADDVNRTLRSTQKHYRKVRSRLEQTDSVRDALSAVPTAELRQSLTRAMADLEAARHNVRRMTFAVGLDEGMTIGELSRLWGFSRQLAARYAKEARGIR
jgi:hypothetical protein